MGPHGDAYEEGLVWGMGGHYSSKERRAGNSTFLQTQGEKVLLILWPLIYHRPYSYDLGLTLIA